MTSNEIPVPVRFVSVWNKPQDWNLHMCPQQLRDTSNKTGSTHTGISEYVWECWCRNFIFYTP